MRGIFDSLEESVIILTPDRSIDDVNPATVKIFGYENKEIIGRSPEILHVDHEHFVEFGRRIKESFDRGASAEFEFEAKRANGEIFPTEHTVSLLKDGNGVAIGIVSVVRDITERKRIEEEKEKVLVDLRKALSEVKQLNGFIPICASCKKIRDDKGYTVIVANNGKEALEIYQTKKEEISLVILDLLMPEMSGRDCLMELIKIDPSVKVLIASGYSPEDKLHKEISPLVKGFVHKPFAVTELLNETHSVLDSD